MSQRSNRNESAHEVGEEGGDVVAKKSNVAGKGADKNKGDQKATKKVRDQIPASSVTVKKGKIQASQGGVAMPGVEDGSSKGSDNDGLCSANQSFPDACAEDAGLKERESHDESSGGARPKIKDVGKLDNDVFKPFGPPSRNSSVSDAVDIAACPGGPSKPCGKPVTYDDEGILCDACNLWFHASCQGVVESDMRAVKRYPSLAWLCSGCKERFSKAPRRCDCCTKLESRLRYLEEALSERAKLLMKVSDGQEHLVKVIKSSHQKLESTVADHSSLTDQKAREDEKRQETYANIVKGSCVEVIKSISSKIEMLPKEQKVTAGMGSSEQISGIVDSVLDKEKRRTNVVVHNFPEAIAESHAERMAMDNSSFIQLVKDEFRLKVSVVKSFRVGRVMAGKQRLLIVTLDSEESKWEVIRQVPQLRHSDQWPRVYLSPGLTRSEREEGRKLREELKRRRDNGEHHLVIKNRKIVEVKSGRPTKPTVLKKNTEGSQHDTSITRDQADDTQAQGAEVVCEVTRNINHHQMPSADVKGGRSTDSSVVAVPSSADTHPVDGNQSESA